MRPSVGKPITPGQVGDLEVIGMGYWAQHHPASLQPRPWEQDPVRTAAGRARRARVVARHSPTTTEEEYREFRECTRNLSERGL